MVTHKPSDLPRVFLHPGEGVFCQTPQKVTTILGSCLAVIMYHPSTHLAAICHCVMPRCPEHCQNPKKCTRHFRFVDCSIRQMFLFFAQKEIQPRDLTIKLFGGSEIKEVGASEAPSVGRLNIQEAESQFKPHGIYPLKEDLGGPSGRKLHFFSNTGEVFLKTLPRLNRSSPK